MTHTEFGHQPRAMSHEDELNPHLQTAEQALRAVQQAAGTLRRVRAAQRSAADSLDKSADNQDRTARVFEDAAEHSPLYREEFRERAGRHRECAHEDRWMAQQMRQMAETITPEGTAQYNQDG